MTVLLFSCEKSKEQITGLKEKFSCIMGSEEFYPKNNRSSLIAIYEASPESYKIFLKVQNNSQRFKRIEISITTNSPLEARSYPLGVIAHNGSENNAFARCYFERSGASEIKEVERSNYETTDVLGGYVDIQQINLKNKTILGTFDFEASNQFGEIIKVNNGKFNLKYED